MKGNFRLRLFAIMIVFASVIAITIAVINHTKLEKVVKVYDRFYIITYAIDESQLISRISLFLPNPIDKKAYPVDDLTHYISTSQQPVIDEEVISALTTSVEAEENIGAHYFDIGIKDDAKEGSDRKNKEV
ncbi:hypothetical protein [Pallidibacillus pasinlerensis]|uniref:Uncharacterized protein n=1 Tax=Pallidibacillus pasinlerensis TaxID=2703818 RepID=A0ABW9ZZS2_9BACI|nr:hypothetical protein [Pallidibacillus pasinlerensis]NCU16677.1 hypothetical protein [Pallidibacillus pasinlerensis]